MSCRYVTHLLYKHQSLTKLITHVLYLQAANTTTVIPLNSLSNVSGQSEVISGLNKLCHCHTAKVNQCLHRNGHVQFCNVKHSALTTCIAATAYKSTKPLSLPLFGCLQYVNDVLVYSYTASKLGRLEGQGG